MSRQKTSKLSKVKLRALADKGDTVAQLRLAELSRRENERMRKGNTQ